MVSFAGEERRAGLVDPLAGPLSRAAYRLAVLVIATVFATACASMILATTAGASVTPWGWGDNAFSQLGFEQLGGDHCDSDSCRMLPTARTNLAGVTAVATGDFFSLALLSDGTVMAWGDNSEGELGDGTTDDSPKPVPVRGLSHVRAVAAGAESGYALLDNGTVMAWGENLFGQLGDGTTGGESGCILATPCEKSPVPVTGLSGVKEIAAGGMDAIALHQDGTVAAWGGNADGELGNGTNTAPATCQDASCDPTPAPVVGLSGVQAIAAGGLNYWYAYESEDFNLAVLSDGTVEAWGANGWGELGQGSSTGPESCNDPSTVPCSTKPLIVNKLQDVAAVSAGGDFGLALLKDGSAQAWGENVAGQLGHGTNNASDCPLPCIASPVPVFDLQGVAKVDAGNFHSLALMEDGTVRAWGDNYSGELGDGSHTGPSQCPDGLGHYSICSPRPVPVAGLNGPTDISAGDEFSLALAPPPNRFAAHMSRCHTCKRIAITVKVPFRGAASIRQITTQGHHSRRNRRKKGSPLLLQPATKQASDVGRLVFELRPTRAGTRLVRDTGKLRAKLLITFTPIGGTPATATVTVTMRRHR